MKQVFSGEDFDAADHICEVRRRPVLVHTLTRPLASVAKCDHEWPEDGHGTDMDGSCTKCGMSFMLYIHCECP